MKHIVWLFLFLSPLLTYSQQQPTPVQRALQHTVTVATIPQAGELLTLRDAITMALAKNYQIRISRTQEQIARNNHIPGNAGFLPSLTGNLNNTNNNQHLRQSYLVPNQAPTDRPGIISRNTTVALTANWTVFNGFAMFYAYDQLGELVRLSEANTRLNIETTIANVATAYYDAIQQLQQLVSLRQALDISRERLELARANYEVGTRSKVDFLSAQVDYNADSAALVAQQQNLRNSKILLNSLLVRDPATEFAVRDTIVVRTTINFEQLRESLTTNNPQLISAKLNRRVADLNIRLVQASRLPTVNLQAGYNYVNINNQGGTGVRTANNNGFNYGLQASVPIFSGYNIRRNIANAKANALIAEYQEANQTLLLQQDLTQTYTQYQNSLTLLNLEAQNYQIAIQNIDIAYERYRVGNSTAVEFRDVQRNAVAAQTRLINAEFNAKAAEIELLRLSSTISDNLQ